MNSALTQLIEQRTANLFWVDKELEQALSDLGMDSMAGVFAFDQGEELVKKNIASFRSRTQLVTKHPKITLFMKRYTQAPAKVQIKNWLHTKARQSNAMIELIPMVELAEKGIGVPRPVAFGQTWQGMFETHSFLITEKIPQAQSLEKQLPDCFSNKIEQRKTYLAFIQELGQFIRQFHNLGFCHRDLYLAHIFRNDRGDLFLIDLARVFKPELLRQRFVVKDLAQLYFSMPKHAFSHTDRLRLYKSYTGKRSITNQDKIRIRKILAKVQRMTQHDIKRGKAIPYLQ